VEASGEVRYRQCNAVSVQTDKNGVATMACIKGHGTKTSMVRCLHDRVGQKTVSRLKDLPALPPTHSPTPPYTHFSLHHGRQIDLQLVPFLRNGAFSQESQSF